MLPTLIKDAPHFDDDAPLTVTGDTLRVNTQEYAALVVPEAQPAFSGFARCESSFGLESAGALDRHHGLSPCLPAKTGFSSGERTEGKTGSAVFFPVFVRREAGVLFEHPREVCAGGKSKIFADRGGAAVGIGDCCKTHSSLSFRAKMPSPWRLICVGIRLRPGRPAPGSRTGLR